MRNLKHGTDIMSWHMAFECKLLICFHGFFLYLYQTVSECGQLEKEKDKERERETVNNFQ